MSCFTALWNFLHCNSNCVGGTISQSPSPLACVPVLCFVFTLVQIGMQQRVQPLRHSFVQTDIHVQQALSTMQLLSSSSQHRRSLRMPRHVVSHMVCALEVQLMCCGVEVIDLRVIDHPGSLSWPRCITTHITPHTSHRIISHITSHSDPIQIDPGGANCRLPPQAAVGQETRTVLEPCLHEGPTRCV